MAGLAPIIGLDQFHYAPLTADETTGATYGDSVHVQNITNANVAFNGTVATHFADNGPAVVSSQIGEVEVEITVSDLPPVDYAFLIGATALNGKISYNVNASAPDVAVGFRAMKADGSFRYLWLLKGKFAVPDQNTATKADSVEFQPQTINFKGVARLSDSNVFFRIDDNDPDLPVGATTTLLTDFFADPDYTPAVT